MTPFEQFAKDFAGKKVLVFGLGLQGRGVNATKLLLEVGASVTITDRRSQPHLQSSLDLLGTADLRLALDSEPSPALLATDFILRNPSVPWEHSFLEKARQQDIPIVMDTALFFRYALADQAIGITGTRGKSTTTALIHHILSTSGATSILGGNSTQVSSLELLKNLDSNAYYVFELSSWELQAFHDQRTSPHYSLITNLYPDHLLDRNFQQYVNDKTAIFRYQSPKDLLVINGDQKITRQLATQSPSRVVFFSASDAKTYQTELRGDHNLENIAAAAALSGHLGIEQTTINQAVSTFSPLPFRLEPVATMTGVAYINDTTSTTPVATIKALSTYPQSILIIGGTTKHLPLDQLASVINSQASHVVLFSGSGTKQLKPHLNPDLIIGEFDSLQAVLNAAQSAARPGDTILFSPGFTSFGAFQNEFDRGRQFNSLLKSSNL